MFLSIDIGGTFIKYALMSENAEILKKGKFKSPKDSLDEFKGVLALIVEEHISQDLEGIAISCPGTIDVEQGIIYRGGSITYLHEMNLTEWLSKKYDLPVSIENDGKSAALAELWMGSIQGCNNAIVLVFGTGVGGGVIIDGKLYRGSSFSAGEASFITANYNLDKKEGTFFGFQASSVRMVNKVSELNGRGTSADGREVFEFIKPSNEESWKVFIDFCKNIAVQVLNLQYILDPEKIVIAGGISVQPIVVKHIRLAISELVNEEEWHNAIPIIEVATLQDNANLVGSLYHHLEQMRGSYQ